MKIATLVCAREHGNTRLSDVIFRSMTTTMSICSLIFLLCIFSFNFFELSSKQMSTEVSIENTTLILEQIISYSVCENFTFVHNLLSLWRGVGVCNTLEWFSPPLTIGSTCLLRRKFTPLSSFGSHHPQSTSSWFGLCVAEPRVIFDNHSEISTFHFCMHTLLPC